MPRFSESRATIAVATGVTVYAGTKTGALGLIPSLGPVSAPLAAIILGFVIATMGGKGGLAGDVIQGVGYGLVGVGALELVAK